MTKPSKMNSDRENPAGPGARILLGLFTIILLLIVGISVISLKYLAPQPTVAPVVVQQAAAATLEISLPVFVDGTVNAILPGAVSSTLTSLAPMPTAIPPTATQPSIPCNQAGFVGDGSYPDGSRIAASTPFTKVWIIRNTGTCAWDENYALVYAGGELMAGKSPITLGRSLAPGDTLEVSVNLVAPASSGLHSGQWFLRTSTGALFGMSPDNIPLEITLSVGTHHGQVLDFVESACIAEWTSAAGLVRCPEIDEFASGAVNPVDQASGEAGYEFTQPVLEVIPNDGPQGLISGTYNLFQIQPEDSFHATIACADNQPECDLEFSLSYDTGNHQPVTLGSWHQITDGSHQKVTVDLSALAGQSIHLILSVRSRNDSAYDNQGLWISPLILRSVK